MATPEQRFGRRLQRTRESEGETRGELGEIVGADTSAVCRWENGDGGPRAGVLMRLLRHYRRHVEFLLFGDASDPEPRPAVRNAALEAFLKTHVGREAQRRGLTPVLASIQLGNASPSAELYTRLALVLLDEVGDDG